MRHTVRVLPRRSAASSIAASNARSAAAADAASAASWIDSACAADNVFGAGDYLSGRFTAGAAIAEEPPVGAVAADFGAAETFVVSVIPFNEIGVEFGDGFVTSEGAGLGGALQRAGEHFGEGEAFQAFPKFERTAFAVGCERNVG